MPKYLVEVKYTLDGMKGLKAQGGTARVAASKALIEEVGGSIESFYFAFGDRDAVIIADLPDNVASAALGLIVGASGGVNSAVTVLLTPEEIDEAAKKQAKYQPPGS
ncbi:MAG TPA: GYD domain-containing protein [Acidimicrobiales bacterium]|nr:GYD domain-containing protein [Acidimicrobiales bacterium]